MGPSFASAGFAPLVPAIGYKGMEKRGTGSQMSIGYRFTERMGIRFTQQYFGKF
jgi:hypothetical protein